MKEIICIRKTRKSEEDYIRKRRESKEERRQNEVDYIGKEQSRGRLWKKKRVKKVREGREKKVKKIR